MSMFGGFSGPGPTRFATAMTPHSTHATHTSISAPVPVYSESHDQGGPMAQFDHHFVSLTPQRRFDARSVRNVKLERYRDAQRARREAQAMRARGGANTMAEEYMKTTIENRQRELETEHDADAEIRAAEEFYSTEVAGGYEYEAEYEPDAQWPDPRDYEESWFATPKAKQEAWPDPPVQVPPWPR